MSNIAGAIDRRLLFEKNNTDPLQNSTKALHIDHEGAQTYQVYQVVNNYPSDNIAKGRLS